MLWGIDYIQFVLLIFREQTYNTVLEGSTARTPVSDDVACTRSERGRCCLVNPLASDPRACTTECVNHTTAGVLNVSYWTTRYTVRSTQGDGR